MSLDPALSADTLTVDIAITISYISIIIFNRSWRNIWTCCRRKITNIDEKEVYEKSKKNQNKGIAIYGLMIPERCRNFRQHHYFVIFLLSDRLSPPFYFPFFTQRILVFCSSASFHFLSSFHANNSHGVTDSSAPSSVMNSSVLNILPCIILFRSPSSCLSISSDQIDVRSSFHIDCVSKQCALVWPCPTEYGRLFCWSVSIAEILVVLRKQFCKIPSRLQKKKKICFDWVTGYRRKPGIDVFGWTHKTWQKVEYKTMKVLL